jgi:hypothetical protein
MLLIISYNVTYVDLVPEYTNEKFKTMRIANFDIQLPESFNLITNNSSYILTYPDYKIFLYEYGSADAIIKLNNNVGNVDREVIIHDFIYFFDKPSILRIYEKGTRYELIACFHNGCIMLRTYIKNENKDKKLSIFINRIHNFLKYYDLLQENKIIENSFRTLLGCIRNNNEFHLSSSYRFYDNRSIYDTSFVLWINFQYITPNDNFQKLRNASFFNKFVRHSIYSMFLIDIINYKWTESERIINFTPSYIGNEFITINADKNKIPIDLLMDLDLLNTGKNESLYNFISISMSSTFLPKENSNINYNILYGYWLKTVESIVLQL